jgi:hypothetical protein
MALTGIVQPADQPGNKDFSTVAANPPKPAAITGFHTFDNVTFSNVQKRLVRRPTLGRSRDSIYIRLPGLPGRPIRPRKFIRVADATVTALRTVTVKSLGDAGGATAGAIAADGFTLTGPGTETFITDGVVAGDIVILNDATSANGRYRVVEVVSELVLRLDCRTPIMDDDVTYRVISPRNFVDVANRLIEQGNLEIRTSAGTLVNPVMPV